MSFINATIPYILIIITALAAGVFSVYRIYNKNRSFNAKALAGMRNYDYSRPLFIARYVCLVLGLVLLAAAVLRPAWGMKKQTIESKGTDVVFTLDVSQSMDAMDVSQGGKQVSRLNAAKAMIADFVTKHPQNRYGLVIFAGDAFVSTPLTMDHSAFLTFLDGVNHNDVGTQGTDIGKALASSIARFADEQDKTRGQSIVLISDGGDGGAGNISGFAAAVKQAHISVIAVGVGSTAGAPIPTGTDVFGQSGYLQYQGQTVITKLNEDSLKQVADETGGRYFHAENSNDFEKIAQAIANQQATTITSQQQSGREDRYQYFLLPACLFFLFYVFVQPRRGSSGPAAAGKVHAIITKSVRLLPFVAKRKPGTGD